MEAENNAAPAVPGFSYSLPVRPTTLDPDPAAAASGRLEWRIEHDFQALADMRETWDKAVVELGGNIYMSYDWCRTWWEFYGNGKQLRIFVLFLDRRVVGIIPLYIDSIGFKPLRLAVARLVCANIPPKAFAPPVHPDCAEPMFDTVLTQLLERDGCDLISIGPVDEAGGLLRHFENAARKRRDLCGRVAREREGVYTAFHLPSSLDQFFDGMDKDERKKRKYEMRLLSKEPEIKRDVISAPEALGEEFESFARLHASQWSGKGKLGHFGSWPQGKQYNQALVQSMARLGRVRFVRIRSGEEVISSQFAFVLGDTWHWELPARAMDRKWNRFSLGTSGFFCLVEAALKEGATRIEGGIAHYDYKQKLNGLEHGMEVLRVASNGIGSRLASRAYRSLRGLLRFAYYKLWYARISPRLPASFRKPIWNFWLRLDF